MAFISDVYQRLTSNVSRINLTLAILLTLGVFAFYIQTLVPSMLDGEPGVYQYISSVLGIPDPSGFPLYVLLGYLWSLLPIGTLAYRMNLLSAFFGALTVGVLFYALRQQKLHWLAALGAGLTLAIVPPFWEYSTLASKYTLHTFLTVLLFAFLVKWESTRQTIWLSSAMFTFGFGLTNNPTFLLLAPATAIFVVLVGGQSLRDPRFLLRTLALVVLPCTLYLYFPLRGYQLLANGFVLPDWNLAVAQGIVSPYFKENLQGLVQYVTASTFISTMVRSWQWDTFVDGANIILQTLSIPIAVISFAGIVWLAKERKAFALWLSVGILTFAWIALPYANAVFGTTTDFTPYFLRYFLPGIIMLVICAAWGIDVALHNIPALLSRFKLQLVIGSSIALILASILLLAAWQDLYMRHSNIGIERSVELQAKWDAIQKYPPEDGAALIGHWGDLTPLWYLQNSEGWRRDIVTFYPPEDEQINAWLAKGKPLYLAGSLLGWAPGIVKNKSLTPWGNLVRVSNGKFSPSSPLSHPTSLTFQDNHPTMRMLGFDVSRERERETVDVAVYWEILDNIPLDNYIVYFSFSVPNVETKSQGDVLVVNWYPTGKLSAGQRALGIYRYPIPKETPPGTYTLNIFIYSIDSARNLDIAETKETIAALGAITVQ